MESADTTKNRRHKAVMITEKIKALEEIDKGVPSSKIANDLGCHPSTVRSWKQKQESIKEWVSKQDSDVAKKKLRLRNTKNGLVDEALLVWFEQNRAAGVPLSGPLLRAKALKFHASLGGQENFKASEGWLSKWKDRHQIRGVSISGEKMSADQAAATAFKNTFAEMILNEELTADQIFNCDETGLNYRMLPQKTLSAKSQPGAPGLKGNKDRITVMACSNASGSLKLPLMVIGKSAKPRALNNIKTLPVYYKSQKSAWMNSTLFAEWFAKEFVPSVTTFLNQKGLPAKAILFVDNCSAHPKILSEGDIRVAFLPPNTTSLIQPMDQGLLKCLKMNYRKKLMFTLLDNLNDGGNLVQYLKSINLKDVIFWLAAAWDELSVLTIGRSWNQLWPRSEYSRVSDGTAKASGVRNNAIGSQLPSTAETKTCSGGATLNLENQVIEFHRTLQSGVDHQDVTVADIDAWLSFATEEFVLMEDEEIIDVILGDQENNLEIVGAEPESLLPTKEISSTEAKNAILNVIQYCDQNGNYSKEDIITLHRIENSIIEQSVQQSLE